ncbi:MAG: hypothetical protein Ct9H300mP12_08940 [Acidimicrobiales bacterium]|nr:MAG: hypothetical protein Ct9H300mP12_08940 [Acidimicrobiales bacterium]
MEYLETVDVAAGVDLDRFRLPVQLVIRPDGDFRGFAGTVVSGMLRPGDPVVSLPSGVHPLLTESCPSMVTSTRPGPAMR